MKDAEKIECLYLGPKGERCYQAANESGFCSAHDPEAVHRRWPNFARIGAAILLLLSMVWPLLADVWHELSHFFR